ncbi:MAG: DUF1269 domain-containing protein [Dongiaceae bacterium]
MTELICVVFDGPRTADKALNDLQIMRNGRRRVELADACVVRRGIGGVQLKQSVNLVEGGMVGGGALGVAGGALVGLLFMSPAAGALLGAGIGAATGAICGALSDYGIDDGFIRRVGGAIGPRRSALFVLVRSGGDQLLPRLTRRRGTVLHRSPAGGASRIFSRPRA